MPFDIQPIHIVIIIIVAFLIFGANRMPEIGRSLGRSISEFRKGTKEAAEGFRAEVGMSSNAPGAPAPAASVPVQPPTPVQSAGPAGNFCIQCGAPNPVEARFCNSCGAKPPKRSPSARTPIFPINTPFAPQS